MSYLTDKAKEVFRMVKPVLMSEEISDHVAQANVPVMTPENTDQPADSGSENQNDIKGTVTRTGPLSMVTAIINGAGVGLLLGALLGLSISPVVSGVIGTLSGLLALLLGVSEKFMSPLKSLRIGAFGFFCVAGIILGMNIRINKILLPSRQTMLHEYRMVGYTKKEALDFIAFREFGLAPAGWIEKKTAEKEQNVSNPADMDEPGDVSRVSESGSSLANNNVSSGHDISAGNSRQFVNQDQSAAESGNLLYSSEINAGECYKLNFASASQPVAEIKNIFERAGGTWKEMAENLEAGLPGKIYVQALFTMRDCFCSPGQSGVLKIKTSDRIRKINESYSLEQIKRTLTEAAGTWTTIVEKISSDIPPEYQKQLFLSLIKIFKS